jgi:hypothetical protein
MTPRPTARTAVRRLLALTTVLALAAGLAACGAADEGEQEQQEDEQDGPEPQGDEAVAGTWTVLSYSIADTDLEPFMMDDIDEMGAVGTQDGLNIVALVDRAADYSEDPVLDLENWVGGKLIEVTAGGGTVLEDMGDVNTGDPQVLADFIARGVADYPADHYALVISDHGASWPGVGGDESSDHDGLSLEEIRAGVEAGIAAAGIERLDLLGFDACLMATYEVASTMAPYADRMLASQELEPGHGWDYTALQGVADAGGATVDELGMALIDGFAAQAQAEATSAEITLSLVDLTNMAAVDEALAAFSGALVEQAEGISPVVGRTLAETLGFGSSPDPSQNTFMTDLAILAGEIGVDALNVSDQADALVRAINDTVLAKVDGQATRGATGLSIYFPPQLAYYDDRYSVLGTLGGWGDFLAAYYSTGASIPEDEQAAFQGEAEVFFDADGLNITGVFQAAAEDNVASTFIRYGVVEADGSTTFIGEEPAETLDDGSGTALGIYDLTRFVIDTAYAYLQLTTDEAGEYVTFDLPMAYYPADGDGPVDALLSLVLDGATGDLLSETYYTHQDDQYGELAADPEGIIVPTELNVLPDGTQEWVGTSDVGLYADLPNLTYDLEDLPSGTLLHIELWVVDFGGNSDAVSATVQVP